MNRATTTRARAGGRGGKALLVCSPVFTKQAWGRAHPLAIGRIATLLDLIAAMGWLEANGYRECAAASREDLIRFHRPDYVDALAAACAAGKVSAEARQRYRIGTMENPLFEGLYERAATSVGGSIMAARLAAGGRIAFHPGGGTHHGRPGFASGFCYFNDPVFAILTLLDEGRQRIVYVDIDAHHGDGVEDAFADDDRVMTISIHEQGRWPHTGKLGERGGGNARNMAVPKAINDSEFALLMDEAVLALIERFAPDAAVVTCGADGLAGDPLSTMALTNTALWQAVEKVAAAAPACVVLGGGGYNPWTVARCWAGLWARLSGQDVAADLPAKARAILAGLECDLVDDDEVDPAWLTTIIDEPNVGPVREEFHAIVKAVLKP